MDLLARLRQQGVELYLEGDKLRLRAPKGALTDELRAALAMRRDEIVEFLRRAQGGDTPPRSRPIRRAPRGGDLPLSFAQERLWFLDRLQPGTAVYNMFESLWARGELSPALLAAVLAEIVRRHEGLRTTFEEREGGPAQVIAPPSRPELPLVDLMALPEEWRRPVARRLIREEALRPFDLARGPLLRARLLRLAADEHALLLNVHHIVSDGWSQGVLVREISALYGAGHAGVPSPLPELPVQYADFAVWQREWLAGAELERQLAYWRRRLAGTLPVLELPFDHPRPAVATHRGAQRAAFLDAEAAGELARLARGHEATLFMVLLAAFQTLLLRLTGEEDLPVGSPVANRNREEIEPLIGFFVNTLVLRGDLAGDPPFRELLARVRRTTLEAYDHQDLPFERLVEALRPERRLSTNPLFQTLCALQNAPAESIELTGLSLSQTPPEVSSTRLDLELLAWDRGEALVMVLNYSPDLFDAPTIQRFSGYLTTLLRGLLADPERPISQAPLLTAGELQQLVREWNDTGREIAGPPLAHGIVARQAALTPDAVAVEHGEERLSYGELAARARRLAAVLRGAGVGPDVPVALWVGRSLALPVAVLAVLEAGGACLPLDPSYPAERLALMIGDAGPRLAVAEAGMPGGLPPGLDAVVLDEHGEMAVAAPGSMPDPMTDPDHLAYVLYTSGSTGRPKGVALPHRALVNMAAWACAVRPERGRRVLQFSPLSFDVSFEEMFSTWGTGGTLVLMPEEMRRDPNALLSFLIERRIERLFQPFVALQQLAEAAREQGRTPASLRELVTAGEQLRITPAVAALCAGGARLFNEYGPTETHLTSAFVLQGEAGGWPALPPIGRPIANHRILLLDRGRRPVPAGVAGELCIGGAGLARGYFRRPELTAERFIPDPGGREPGARLYRTGDLARWMAGGDLEYLGRTDFQVKVRGYRVEPGEVEMAVVAHPGVRDAAVVARQDPGGLRLVAYVVWEGESAEAVLREALKATLPAPMVPSAFVGLAALPLTPSGKVDRRALAGPSFAAQGVAATAGYVEPAAGAERELAAIWSEVLGIERVGAGDDFFDLGGHSLLATRVVSRVRQALGVELPLRVIFEAPTIAGLAAWIERARAVSGATAGGPAVMPPVARAPRDLPPPLSFAQTRLWFLDRLAPGSVAYTLPFALRLSGELSPAALAAVLGEVVRRHEALRTTFAERGGEPVQVIAPAGRWLLPLTDLDSLPAEVREAEARRLAESAAARPFDLERGPLFRAVLLRLGAAEHLLLLEIHHIVADGWSLGVLVEEITALYGAALAGAESPLPELPIQYADFAVWQRSWLQGEELLRRLAYWRDRLAGSPAILELPADRPRPAVPARPVGRVTTVFSPDLARQLARFAQRNRSSLFMLLLAGFQALLGRLTGQRDIPLGSPVANRNQAEFEPLIGFFVNLLVLRGDLAGDLSFRDLLARVRQSTLEDYAHQDLPFELLVEELRPQRHLSATPLFQAMCALQNAPMGSMDLPGLSFAPLEVEPSFTRFDLELNASESEGALVVSFIYSAELFDRTTVQRLAGFLEALLRGAAADDGRRLSELPLLTDAGRHQLAVEWNDTRPAAAPDSVLARFAAQVAACPDAVALEAGEERLTYAELDRRANRLAHRLRRLGAGGGEPVGLFAERSAEMVTGLLAIWKAGGAYLPLDPAHPPARLAYLLEDSEVPVIAAGAGLAEALPPGPARIVPLDGSLEDDGLEDDCDLPPDGAPGPGDPAYRIYTSGTTGGPKAVLVEHGALAGTLAAVQEAFGFRPGDRMPCIASFSFDIFLFELLGPLLAGGTCVLLPLRPTLDLERLLGELDTATHLHAVPALMRQVLELARRHATAAPRLRGVFTGGDAVPADLLADLRDAFPRAAVRELYGPTETTIVCSFWPVPAEGAVRSLLGRPFAGVEIHVRDGAGNPSPIGAPGEIWIGGGGVARGYWRREELTAEKFVVSAGRRFFRSGDRARRLPDGTLEFLGRADQQVKVRGFRIELGEVEAALLRLPGVKATVVEAREVVAGAGPQLVAYVVPHAAAGAAPPAELRRALEAELPDYMVPSWFVPLEALPLTAHGKVDRRALPDPDPAAGRKSEYLPPATAIEESLAAACAEVLGLERVGMSDNFFALGGHSLLAVQLTSRLRDRYALEVPLQMVFEAPDLLDLANRLVGQVMAEVGDLSLEELQALLSAEETAP